MQEQLILLVAVIVVMFAVCALALKRQYQYLLVPIFSVIVMLALVHNSTYLHAASNILLMAGVLLLFIGLLQWLRRHDFLPRAKSTIRAERGREGKTKAKEMPYEGLRSRPAGPPPPPISGRLMLIGLLFLLGSLGVALLVG